MLPGRPDLKEKPETRVYRAVQVWQEDRENRGKTGGRVHPVPLVKTVIQGPEELPDHQDRPEKAEVKELVENVGESVKEGRKEVVEILENPEKLVRREIEDQLVSMENQEELESKDRWDFQVKMVNQEELDHKDKEEKKDQLDSQDQRAPEVSPEQTENQDHLE